MKDLIRQILIEERKPKGYWDDEINLENAARDCDTLNEFQEKYQTAYKKAKLKGVDFFNRITDHMIKPKSLFPYTEEELEDIASKYQTKKDFIKYNGGAYQVALRIDKKNPGFFNKITSHMLSLGSKHKRMIYGYFFPNNNAVYIGLTYNIDVRNKQHLVTDVDEKKQTTVGKFINETKEIPQLVKFTDYLDVKDAQNKESEYVDKFKNSGYLILNKVKTGGLGHGLKYSEDELKKLLSFIFNYKDLYTKHYRLYRAAKNRGLDFLHDVTKHMGRNQINWSEELVRQYAKDFDSKNEFQTAFGGAANYAKIHKFWDDLFPKDIPSEDEIVLTASQYDTQNDFRRAHPQLYTHATNLNLLPKIRFKKSKKRGPSLTPDDVIRLSQNYNTLKDFYKNENSAYRRAMIFCEKLGDEFCIKVFGRFR
jgi:hypothetical protein